MRLSVKRDALTWSSPFSVGIASIDDDHRYALDLLGVLEEVDGDALRLKLEQVLDRLTIFAHFHFQREEIVFREAGLTLDAAHRADHDYFKFFIAEMRSDVSFGVSNDRIHGIVDFMRAWASQHFADHDGKLRTATVDTDHVDRIARERVPPLSYLIGIH